jgi:hypothetical protein
MKNHPAARALRSDPAAVSSRAPSLRFHLDASLCSPTTPRDEAPISLSAKHPFEGATTVLWLYPMYGVLNVLGCQESVHHGLVSVREPMRWGLARQRLRLTVALTLQLPCSHRVCSFPVYICLFRRLVVGRWIVRPLDAEGAQADYYHWRLFRDAPSAGSRSWA